MTEDRERHSRLATDLEREAELLRRRRRGALASRRRRNARAEAVERADLAEDHRRRAAQAHEQLRELGNSGGHLYPWFERHQHALGRGLAAELSLNAAQGAVYHVLGAPGIASLTAACLTTDRAIAIGELGRLVKRDGDIRQRLLFGVAAELYGREQGVSLSELLAELDGEDLDRVLEAIALVKQRRSTIQGSPDDLWIRAAEPAAETDRYPTGSQVAAAGRSRSGRTNHSPRCHRGRSGVWSLSRCISTPERAMPREARDVRS